MSQELEQVREKADELLAAIEDAEQSTTPEAAKARIGGGQWLPIILAILRALLENWPSATPDQGEGGPTA